MVLNLDTGFQKFDINLHDVDAAAQQGCLLFQMSKELWSRERQRPLDGIDARDLVVRIETFGFEIVAFGLWNKKKAKKHFSGYLGEHKLIKTAAAGMRSSLVLQASGLTLA